MKIMEWTIRVAYIWLVRNEYRTLVWKENGDTLRAQYKVETNIKFIFGEKYYVNSEGNSTSLGNRVKWQTFVNTAVILWIL